MSLAKQVLILGLLLTMTACAGKPLRLGSSDTNTGLFESPEALGKQLTYISRGASKKWVYVMLGIDESTSNLAILTRGEIWNREYGNSIPQGSPEKLRRLSEEFATLNGWKLPFISIYQQGHFDPLSLSYTRTELGHNLTIVAIFRRKKLHRLDIEGTRTVNNKNTITVWSLMGGLPGQAVNAAGKMIPGF